MDRRAVTLRNTCILEKAILLPSLSFGSRIAFLYLLQKSLRRYFALVANLSNMTPMQWKSSLCNGKPHECSGKVNSVRWKVGLHK
jgi:hypothetical protein